MTLLFYVDESVDDLHEFHVGILVDGANSARAVIALDEIVKTAAFGGACFPHAELHGYEIHGRSDAWQHASVGQSIQVYRSSLDVLADCSIEVMARGVNLARFAATYGPTVSPYRWEFSNLLERLNERLSTRDEYGIVISDEQHEYRKQLQKDVVDSQRYGTGGYRDQHLFRVLDTAHFVDSKLSRLTQLADLVAFIMRRRQSIPRESDARADKVMADLAARVYRAIPEPAGKYFTIRH